MEKLTKEEKEKTQKLVYDLGIAFAWGKTKQGYNYWRNIRNELFELGEETKRPTCGK